VVRETGYVSLYIDGRQPWKVKSLKISTYYKFTFTLQGRTKHAAHLNALQDCGYVAEQKYANDIGDSVSGKVVAWRSKDESLRQKSHLLSGITR
jgi:hypothetical protein